jgi:nucleoid-associated protein YgaU
VGSMQQAVLEFDEEVQAPWRPRLRAEEVVERPRLRALPPPSPARAPQSRVAQVRVPSSRPPQARAGSGAPARPRDDESRRPTRPHPAGPVRGGCAHPAHRPERPGGVRLTARGRLLVAVLALTGGVVLAAVVGVAGGNSGGLRLAGEKAVVVQPGDTVWGIAASISGDDDIRAVVDEIQQLNHLHGAPLVPGQALRLP